MSKVFLMLKGNSYCGGNIRIKGGEEGGIAVFSGGQGGKIGLVEKVTFMKHLDSEGKNHVAMKEKSILGRGNTGVSCVPGVPCEELPGLR